MNKELQPHEPITIETIADFARETALRENGQAPLLIAQGDRGLTVAMFDTPPDSFEMRQFTMYHAGMALAKSRQIGILQQIYFISEAWMSLAGHDTDTVFPLRDDPDRKEVLIVSGIRMQDLKASLIIFEMLRDEDHGLMDLRKFDPPQTGDGEVQSPLLDAFLAGYFVGVGGSLN